MSSYSLFYKKSYLPRLDDLSESFFFSFWDKNGVWYGFWLNSTWYLNLYFSFWHFKKLLLCYHWVKKIFACCINLSVKKFFFLHMIIRTIFISCNDEIPLRLILVSLCNGVWTILFIIVFLLSIILNHSYTSPLSTRDNHPYLYPCWWHFLVYL